MKNEKEMDNATTLSAQELQELEQLLAKIEFEMQSINFAWHQNTTSSNIPSLQKLASKKIPYLCPLPPIENLVFSGGGVRGVVYPGVIEVLEELQVLDSVKRVAGTSAGAIIAMLVALGFSARQIHEDSDNTNFAKFMDRDDASFWDAIGLSIVSKAFDLLNEQKKGIYKGDIIHAWIQIKVFEATGNPRATFKDLHAASIENPLFKDLFLTGTDIISHALWEFSWETTPDVAVADAVRASMSFPGAFENIFIDVGGMKRPFVDGGVIAMYPMHLFDDTTKLNPQYATNSAGANPCTLGIRVDCKEEMDNLLWCKHPQLKEDTVVLEHLEALQKEQPEQIRNVIENIKEEIKKEQTGEQVGANTAEKTAEKTEPSGLAQAINPLNLDPVEITHKAAATIKEVAKPAEKPRLRFTEYIKSIIMTMYSNHPEVWNRYSTNSVQVFDEDHDTLDFAIDQKKKDQLYKSGRDCTQRWFELYRSPRAYYYMEEEDQSSRYEMQRKPKPEKLQKLWEDLLYQKAIYQHEQKDEFSIEMMALERRLMDIEQHPLVKVTKPSELAIQLRCAEYIKHKAWLENNAKEAKKGQLHRYEVMKYLREKTISYGLYELLTDVADMTTIELYILVFGKELYETILNETLDTGRNIFVSAAEHNQLTVIKRLIQLEKDLKMTPALLNLEHENQETALYAAAKYGHKDVVKYLLELGAKVDESGPMGDNKKRDSALVVAARHNQIDLVKAFLDWFNGSMGKFCDLKAQDASGLTVLHYLLAHGSNEAILLYFNTVKKFFDGYAKDYLDIADAFGQKPIHVIAQYGRREVLQQVQAIFCYEGRFSSRRIEDLFSLNIPDFNGKTPLDYAVYHGHPEMVEALFEAGVKPPDQKTKAVFIDKAKDHKRHPVGRPMRRMVSDYIAIPGADASKSFSKYYPSEVHGSDHGPMSPKYEPLKRHSI